jgi:hypothetical protein
MKIGKGINVERIKIENLFLRKRSIQIYNRPCVICPFALEPENKNGFFTCCNPYVIYKSKVRNYGNIINCADSKDYLKCEYARKAETILLNDFIRIKNIIKKTKLVDNMWLHFSSNKIDLIIDRLKIHNKEYFIALVQYFGYMKINDENVDGYLFTNNIQYLKDIIILSRH